MQVSTQERSRLALVLVAAGVAAAAVVFLLGLVSDPAAHLDLVVGDLASGALAVATGLALLVALHRSAPAARPSLRLMSVAMLPWGLGQLLNGTSFLLGTGTVLGLGDRLSLCAAPIAFAGLLRMPRPRTSRVQWGRLGLDATLLGAVAALVLWQTGFHDVLGPHGLDAVSATALGTIVAELLIVSLLLLAWLRDLDPALLLAILGVGLYTVADLVIILAAAHGHAVPTAAPAMWCVAMPVIGLALRRLDPARTAEGETLLSDLRVTSVTSVLALGCLLASLVTVAVHGQLDHVSVGLALCALVVHHGRELHGAVARRAQLARLTEQALTDPLTGLGNRRAMQQALARLDEGQHAVLSVDLDGFKEVNDLLGHTRGDQLLVAVAARLREGVPADAQVFRIGGDEFAVVVPGDALHAERVGEAVLVAARAAAADVQGSGAVGVSASVGVARLGDRTGAGSGDEDALAVLVESGAALRSAKRAGRDRVETYDGAVAATHRRGLLLERRLRQTLADGGLDVHYQPVVALGSRQVVGLEALARWDDQLLGRVTPDEFVPLAERSGLVVELGRQVIERTLRELGAAPWLPRDVRLAVNVSPVQLRAADFADDLLQTLAQHDVDPGRFVVEVTEQVFVDEDDGGTRQLTRLRDGGVQVAIDDFGSGYSNLAYLGRLPATILKVDRSITEGVLTDHRSAAILRAVVDLGAALPIDVCVEGIETGPQHDLVRDTGALFGQGWLYGAAVPAAELPALLARIAASAPRVSPA
ncbi:putative bifunctional diguanylate cyclase/phosphodiesterase [Angustibacter aerolatus]